MNRTILFFAFMLIATGARGNDYAGIYILVSVDETAIPGMVSHEGHDMMLYSGVFTIHAGGTCISQTVFSVPSGEKIKRQVNATYTQDGSTLNMQWEGAGRTMGVVEGETFTMNNEGMIFSYTKQSALPPEVAIKEAIVPKRNINGDFQGRTYEHASGLTMPLYWDGGGGAFHYEMDGSNGYMVLSNSEGTWTVAHTSKPPIPLAELGLTAGQGVTLGADIINLGGTSNVQLKFEQYKDGGMTPNGINQHQVTPSQSWRTYGANFAIKPDTDSVVFAIVGVNEFSSCGVDNVSYIPIPSPPVRKVAATPVRAHQKTIVVGQPLPELAFTDLEDNRVDVGQLKGKVVLIDFWATWCGPCRTETPNLLSVYKDYHDKGLEIVGISLDKDRQRLDEYLVEHKIQWPNHFDGKGWKNEVATRFDIHSIPNIVVLDREGIVKGTKLRGDNIRQAVSQLVEGDSGTVLQLQASQKISSGPAAPTDGSPSFENKLFKMLLVSVAVGLAFMVVYLLVKLTGLKIVKSDVVLCLVMCISLILMHIIGEAAIIGGLFAIFPFIVPLYFVFPLCGSFFQGIAEARNSSLNNSARSPTQVFRNSLRPRLCLWVALWTIYFVALEIYLYRVVGGGNLVVSVPSIALILMMSASCQLWAPRCKKLYTLILLTLFTPPLVLFLFYALSFGFVFCFGPHGYMGLGLVTVPPLLSSILTVIAVVVMWVRVRIQGDNWLQKEKL
ncbi:MAG: TlpA family protein disulfide reductase [Planctomycetota bacterium]|jgi:thiol-disulfide isomerase/thioredoxin